MSKNYFDEITKTIESEDYEKEVLDILFSKNEFIYVASERGADFVDRLYKDGTRKTGKSVNGEWTECQKQDK